MTPAIRTRAVAANDVDFAILEAGSGPLALCLHGFPDCAQTWRHLLPALADAGFHAVAPFMRGYAPTSPAPDGRYQAVLLALDAVALLGALGDGRGFVVGHDWGGAVAWSVAARRRSVVERLVVLNCPPPQILARAIVRSPAQLRRSWYVLFFQLPWLPERRMAANAAEVVARALVGGSYRREAWTREEVDAYRAAFARPGRAKAAIDWYRAGFRRSVRPRRGRVRGTVAAPTLVLWGVEDRVLGRELVTLERLRGAFSEGNVPSVVLIEDAGHFVQNEAPERVNDELLRWLGPAA